MKLKEISRMGKKGVHILFSNLFMRSVKTKELFRKDKRGVEVSHSLFDDDFILFWEAYDAILLAMTFTLDIFCNDSGQSINYEKSTLILSSSTPAYLCDMF